MRVYQPPAIDERSANTIIKLAEDLASGGAVDEGTPDVADKLIDGFAAQWIAEAKADYEKYRAELPDASGRSGAAARVASLRLRYAHHSERLLHLGVALNAARERIARPDQMAGRPWTDWVHFAVLAVVAAADFIAFGYVIRVVFDVGVVSSSVLVCGFTATVMYLSHVAGMRLRARQDSPGRWAGLIYPVSCLVTILLIGAIAFYVRIESFRPLGTGGFSEPGVPTEPAAGGGLTQDLIVQALPGALLFLALFAATTLVALSGAYLTHDPVRAAYALAMRKHGAATRITARELARLKAAEQELDEQAQVRVSSQRIFEEAIASRYAFAAVLKQRVRLEISKRLKDPVITGAYTSEPKSLTDQLTDQRMK